MSLHHNHNLMHQQAPSQQQRQQTEYYSGQWTKEEQDYVACLVEGFKNGSLDIPDGTSLRFFIAAKLGCKPKRVSKKYERSGYNGKQVYRRDSNISTKDLEDYRQRLTESEHQFKESRALVVSMQEAKTDSRPSSSSNSATITETPIISLSSMGMHHSASQAAALEDRLVAMRSQIDRATNMLNLQQQGMHQQQPLHNTMNMNMNSMNRYGMMANPSPDVLQAMMIQRQRAAALGAGFSTPNGGFPSHGLHSSSSMPSSSSSHSPPPTNKLLIDLYQRRQQLIMSYAMGGAGGAGGTAGSMPSSASGGASNMYAMDPPASPQGSAASLGEKRGLEDLEAEEQARKRARAA